MSPYQKKLVANGITKAQEIIDQRPHEIPYMIEWARGQVRKYQALADEPNAKYQAVPPLPLLEHWKNVLKTLEDHQNGNGNIGATAEDSGD